MEQLNLDEHQKAILADAVNTFGETNQMQVLKEECAELIVAVSHYGRGREGAYENVVEELADVQIMIWQMLEVFGEKFFQNYITSKILRLESRLDKYKKENNIMP